MSRGAAGGPLPRGSTAKKTNAQPLGNFGLTGSIGHACRARLGVSCPVFAKRRRAVPSAMEEPSLCREAVCSRSSRRSCRGTCGPPSQVDAGQQPAAGLQSVPLPNLVGRPGGVDLACCHARSSLQIGNSLESKYLWVDIVGTLLAQLA